MIAARLMAAFVIEIDLAERGKVASRTATDPQLRGLSSCVMEHAFICPHVPVGRDI
jgi:hypothetical protein